MRIFHISLPEKWEAWDGGQYEADSLAAEGFIHCSFSEQLEGVLQRYYSEADRIVILEIDTDKLSSRLVVEPSTGGESYPHIYGPIEREAVVAVKMRELR